MASIRRCQVVPGISYVTTSRDQRYAEEHQSKTDRSETEWVTRQVSNRLLKAQQ